MSAIYDRHVAAVLAGAWTAVIRPLVADADLTAWETIRDESKRPDQMVAGLLACHAIRIHAAILRDTDDSVPLWADPLADTGRVLRHGGVDERLTAALAIRRAIARGPAGDPGADRARLVAAVLASTGSGLAAYGQAARGVAGEPKYYRYLGAAWYAMYGSKLLDDLAERQPAGGGRPRRESVPARQALRAAVRGMAEARMWTKVELSRMAEVSRPTLDDWLREPDYHP